MSVAIPRIRDFRGLRPSTSRPRQLHDGRPRADHLPRDRLRRRSTRFAASTSRSRPRAQTDDEGYALLGDLRHAVRPQEQPDGPETPGFTSTAPPPPPPDGQDVPARQSGEPKYQTRDYSRCRRCGRSRAVYRSSALCLIGLRELAHAGHIPGMTKKQLVVPMSMTDPVADFLTRIHNGIQGEARRPWRSRRASSRSRWPASCSEQGYINGYEIEAPNAGPPRRA